MGLEQLEVTLKLNVCFIHSAPFAEGECEGNPQLPQQ